MLRLGMEQLELQLVWWRGVLPWRRLLWKRRLARRVLRDEWGRIWAIWERALGLRLQSFHWDFRARRHDLHCVWYPRCGSVVQPIHRRLWCYAASLQRLRQRWSLHLLKERSNRRHATHLGTRRRHWCGRVLERKSLCDGEWQCVQ